MLIRSALRGLGVLLEDECQAKCSKDYAENGGDIKLDLCEAGCGGEDATRDVLVGKLQDSINTLANREDKNRIQCRRARAQRPLLGLQYLFRVGMLQRRSCKR